MNRSKIAPFALAILILGLEIGAGLQACVLIINNDTDKTILIAAHNGTVAKIIKPGMTRKFGTKKAHAHFNLMVEASMSGVFECLGVVKQTACSATKDDVSLSASEIINDKLSEINSKIFSIIECTAMPNDVELNELH